MSASRRWVVMALCPGRRRSSSRWISSAVIGTRGGQPSTMTPTAGPCDSPKVVMRNGRAEAVARHQRTLRSAGLPGRCSIMPRWTDSPAIMKTRPPPSSICSVEIAGRAVAPHLHGALPPARARSRRSPAWPGRSGAARRSGGGSSIDSGGGTARSRSRISCSTSRRSAERPSPSSGDSIQATTSPSTARANSCTLPATR